MQAKIIETAPDYAKAIAITLVVFGHALRGLITSGIIEPSPFWAVVDSSIYLFHMPMFFYLSGLFFERQLIRSGTTGYIKKIFHLLIVPMIIWSYIQFSLQYLAGDNANNALDLKDVFMAPFPPKQQFWFLGTLFVMMSLTAIAVKKSAMNKILMVGTGICVLITIFAYDSLAYYTRYNNATNILAQVIIHYPFFAMGIMFGSNALRRLPVNIFLCMAALLVFLSIDTLYNPAPVVGMVLAAACLLAIYKFCLNLEVRVDKRNAISKAVTFIGMNSMIIYLAHVIASGGVRAILLKLHVTSADIHLALGTLAGLLLPLLLVPVGLKMEKYVPKIAYPVFPVRYQRT